MSEALEYFQGALADLAPNTQKQYSRQLNEFLDFMNMTPDELFNAQLKAYQSNNPRDMMRIPRKLRKFQEKRMEEEGISGYYATGYYDAIKKFFKSNALPFEGNRLTADSGNGWPYISHEEIRTIVEVTGNAMLRTAIVFGKDAALRVGDMVKLPVSIIQPILDDPELEWFTFEWKQEKTKRYAYPVVGPEGIKYIRTWMDWRRRKGINCAPDAALFCKVRGEPGGYMATSTLSTTFSRARNKAGLGDRDDPPVFHSLRKFHKTNLEAAMIHTSWVNVFQGRKGVGSGQIYTVPPDEERIEMFQRGYDRLRLYGGSKNLEKELEMAKKERRAMASTLFKALMSDNPRQVLLAEGLDPDELMEMLRTDREGFVDELMRRLQNE